MNAAPEHSPFGNKFWIITSTTIDPALDLDLDGKPDTDVLKMVPACERDDADQFREDGTIVTNRGKLSCDEDEENEEETGTWSYDAKAKKMTTHKHDSRRPVEMILVEQSPSKLVFTSAHKSARGNHTIRAVFTVKN